MIVGFDDDLAGEAPRVSSRLHDLLTQIHPSLERVLGPRLRHQAVLTMLERFGSLAQIRGAGRRRLVTLLRPEAPRMAEPPRGSSQAWPAHSPPSLTSGTTGRTDRGTPGGPPSVGVLLRLALARIP
jgi:hypothetical protein